jgi:hypothetical protein
MGSIEPLGPSASGLRLVESRVQTPSAETSVFDGLDTSIAGLAVLAGLPPGTMATELAAVDAAARQSLADYRPLEPERLVPVLARGLRATRAARAALRSASGSPDARADADFLLSVKEADFTEALAQAAGVTLDPLADAETVTPGDAVGVNVRVFVEHPALATLSDFNLVAPAGWRVEPARETPGGGGFRRETPTAAAQYRVTVPGDAQPTQPYFLRQPRTGDAYAWSTDMPRTRPFDAPLLTASVAVVSEGVPFTLSRPVQYRFADRVRGELRRDVETVPSLSVGLDSNLLIYSTTGAARTERLVVTARSFSPRAVAGTLRLRLPEGWTATPAAVPFMLTASGEVTSTSFGVTPPRQRAAGSVTVRAEAEVDGRVFSQDVQTIAYPHIQTHRLLAPATATARLFDLVIAPVRVGYVMGSGDEVPDALRRMGVDVTIIDASLLTTGDLSRFDTLVVGVRASEARPDFISNQARLRAYMEQGGTLIVQYQQTDYVDRGLPPYPVQSQGNSRVTDETAAVRLLQPDHPLFIFPNRITAADFDGWVQERNLYAFGGTLDGRYVPLLESADAGEPPQRGGEVYAPVGKGHYVYTSYAWFRQLRAGVPGAYRQFANLISLPKAPAIRKP